MKYVKILGLLAVAAAALMAFAASASATTITSPTGTVATPEIHAENEGGHVTLKNALVTIQCSSTVTGKVTSHGEGVTAAGHISTLDFTSCTNNWHVTTTNPGTLEIHWENGYNGILTSTGAKVDATRFGLTCVYETSETPIGTVTGGNPATLTISANIPIGAESGASCGTGTAAWSGSYVTKQAIYVDK